MDPALSQSESGTAGTSAGPLDGLLVIETGVLVAGPYAGQLLADLGAQVIKVEMPGKGDPSREWYDGYLWPIVARNKKSVELDLRCSAGQAAFRQLVAKADIVCENFRPGTFEKWNLGYEQLREINAGVIMLRTTGYGQTGPMAARSGYASTGEAMGGLRYVAGYPDRPPVRIGISIGDTLAAIFSTVGALAAIHERQRSGLGQVVDTAIYESVFACMESLLPEYVFGGRIRERSGSTIKNMGPSNAYPTRDGEMIIAANQDTLFQRLCTAMEMPGLLQDERFNTHTNRGRNQEVLDDIIAAWTRQWTSKELEAILDRSGLAYGGVYRAPDMLVDPQFLAREAIVKVAHKTFGEFPMQNVFPRLTRTPGKVRWVGPELGEHNQEVLAGMLGLTHEQINAAQGR